jgi:hypothetical protein
MKMERKVNYDERFVRIRISRNGKKKFQSAEKEVEMKKKGKRLESYLKKFTEVGSGRRR